MLSEARQARNMPFLRRGMRVEMDGRPGCVTSGSSTHLRVRFDGERFSRPVHPQWEMVYFGQDGHIVADYRKQEGARDE